MQYKVYLKKSAERELNRIPDKIHDKIVEHLLSLQENPRPNSSKKLHGQEGYRIRIGDYRILYIIEEIKNKIEIYSIVHRKDAYR